MHRIVLLGSFILSMTFLPNALAHDKPGDPGMGPKQAQTPPPDSSDAGKKPGEAGRARNPNSRPWDHDLVIVESTDGNTWSKPTTFVDRGGVPSIVHDSGGKLIAAFQWFPMDDANKSHFDQIAVVTSSDNGKTWDKPTTIVIEGFPKDAIRPCDPTLAVLDDGKIRIYFTSQEAGTPNNATYSAISSDGTHYTFEPGVRFKVQNRQVQDCAVARLGNKWHYFAPLQKTPSKAYHGISDDGLTFKSTDDISIEGDRRWLGCAVTDGDHLRFFGTAPNGIWTATSTDGVEWKVEEHASADTKTPKEGKEPNDGKESAKKKTVDLTIIKVHGADPAAVKTADGRWLLIVTGPPRADAGKNAPPEERPVTKPAPKPKAEGGKKGADGEKKPG